MFRHAESTVFYAANVFHAACTLIQRDTPKFVVEEALKQNPSDKSLIPVFALWLVDLYENEPTVFERLMTNDTDAGRRVRKWWDDNREHTRPYETRNHSAKFNYFHLTALEKMNEDEAKTFGYEHLWRKIHRLPLEPYGR